MGRADRLEEVLAEVRAFWEAASDEDLAWHIKMMRETEERTQGYQEGQWRGKAGA